MCFCPWFINIFPFARARIKAAWPLQKASMEGFIQWLCRIDIERVEVENASRSCWWKEHRHGHALTTQRWLNGRVWEAPLWEEKWPILNEWDIFHSARFSMPLRKQSPTCVRSRAVRVIAVHCSCWCVGSIYGAGQMWCQAPLPTALCSALFWRLYTHTRAHARMHFGIKADFMQLMLEIIDFSVFKCMHAKK